VDREEEEEDQLTYLECTPISIEQIKVLSGEFNFDGLKSVTFSLSENPIVLLKSP
jgi:hypothetical protein